MKAINEIVLQKRVYAMLKENWLLLSSLALLLLSPLHKLPALLASLLFGFVLPGYALLHALHLQLSLEERILLYPLLSVLLSTHAVYWVSYAIGYSQTSIALSFAPFALLLILKKQRAAASEQATPKKASPHNQRSLQPSCSLQPSHSLQPRTLAPLLIALTFGAILYVAQLSMIWRPSDEGIVVGGWNWGDFFLHAGIVSSLNEGNWPLQTPFFAGEALPYHWFVDLHTALLSKFSQIDFITIMRFENALYPALFLLACCILAQAFLRRKGAGVVALTVALIVLSGGLGWLRLVEDVAAAKAPIAELIKRDAYDNDGRFFQVPSLLAGYLIVQRPQMIGLPIFATVLFLTLSALAAREQAERSAQRCAVRSASNRLERRRRLFLTGLLIGLGAPFQFYAAMSAGIVTILYFALQILRSAGEQRAALLRDSAYFLAPLALGAPFGLGAASAASQAGLLKIHLGWLAPKESAIAFIAFYLANLGVPFALALLALIALAFKPQLIEVREKTWLAACVAVLFAIPNLFSFSGTLWDMTKFFAFMTIPVGIFGTAVLLRLPKASWPLILASCIASPLLAFAWNVGSNWIGLTWAEINAGEWIKANTPQRTVFATATSHNSPVDAVAGRLRILGYEGWAHNLGLQPFERSRALQRIFCSDASEAAMQLKRLGASYVYVGTAELNNYRCAMPFVDEAFFEKVYERDHITIYKVKS